jgi:CubicO group peptidase (beta-lactamase class C family)
MAIDQSDLRRCGLAWGTKVICSGVFITGRDPWDVVRQSCNFMIATEEEIQALVEKGRRLNLEERLAIDIDLDRNAVTLTLDDVVQTSARHFEGQGCVIVPDSRSGVEFAPTPVKPEVLDAGSTAWPLGDVLAEDSGRSGIDLAKVDAAVDLMFENSRQYTNAFVVVHRGVLVRERYAEPFGRETRFESWSMGKSVAASLAGLLVRDGLLDLEAPLPFKEWQSPNDPRAAIRAEDLLHMSSGLEFTGSQGPNENPLAKSQEGKLFDHLYVYAGAIDAFGFCTHKPAEYPPNRVGRYRNCDPLLLTRLVRDTVRARGESFLTWPQRNLFDPLGIAGIVLETDPYGNFLITGHDYGRARDWARLGLLYLQKGAWGRKQLLPESFVEFVQTPAPAFETPEYGGFFWLNRARTLATLPEDAYWMAGAGGQRVVIVPSLDLVIVRMGHLNGEIAGWAETMDRANALLVEAVTGASRAS